LERQKAIEKYSQIKLTELSQKERAEQLKPTDVNYLLDAVKKKLIIDQKIIDKTLALSSILQSQKQKLDNYARFISHELKYSPKNVSDLLAWTQEEFENTNTFEDFNSHIPIMGEKVEKMELLLVRIEQYLNITPASSKNNTINLNAIAKRVIHKIGKSTDVKITINNELPTLFADENMFESVFEILIQNAVDHIIKEKGLIELVCETTEKEYVFSIKDNGVGINAKYHEKIFEMFEAAELTKSTRIGLSIVDKIISHYNGKIFVESSPNKGTIFYFNLPKTNKSA
jgi:two-component system sensor histidine kinase/response regulator